MRLFILFLLCSAGAYALTASPAVHEVAYHVGTESYSITVSNDEQRSLTLTITPTGPLSQLISVQPEVTLAPGEQKTLAVHVQMPDQTQPGILESGLLIEARPISGGTVGATSAVLHIIRVQTPSTGTYLSGELLSSSGIVHSPVSITLSVTNTGSEPLQGVQGAISVADQTLTTSAIDLAPGQTQNLPVSWTPQHVGSYDATASVHYADKQLSLATNIIVGNLSVRIQNVTFGDFRLGDPFRVTAYVQSEWGTPLPATARVAVNQGHLVGFGTSTAVTLAPLQPQATTIFVEPNSMQVGPANLTVTVAYADKTVATTVPIVISIDQISVPSASKPYNRYALYVLAAAVLVFIIIFIKRRRSLVA